MDITNYKRHLLEREKSRATVEKYTRDVNVFLVWLGERELDKGVTLEYKSHLAKTYAPRSANSVISSLNSYFDYLGRAELKIQTIKIQRQIFARKDKELTRAEYDRLLTVARRKSERLYYVMQTIFVTCIRVSELRHITVEAISAGQAEIRCKGKLRVIILTKDLCKMLRAYASRHGIKHGAIFVTRSGRPLERTNIWSEMKKLCKAAHVAESKVFPHNLRHLFARSFYAIKKDIVRLADILGHSSINTTRIYTMESGDTHRRLLEKLNLLRC